MNKRNVIIVHGAYGSPTENWFGWLHNELTLMRLNCLVPQLPTPNGQSLSSWMDKFNESVGSHINEKTILIGHSLGAVFLLNRLQRENKSVFTTVLVATFLGRVGIDKFDLINESFFSVPFEWEAIRNKSQHFWCYHGEDDPYVSLETFNHISQQLLAKKIIVPKGGHLNEAAGYYEFPELLHDLISD